MLLSPVGMLVKNQVSLEKMVRGLEPVCMWKKVLFTVIIADSLGSQR